MLDCFKFQAETSLSCPACIKFEGIIQTSQALTPKLPIIELDDLF